MRLKFVGAGVLQIALLTGSPSFGAPDDPYKITPREKAACTADAIRLCSHTYPDESALLQCMKTNKSALSTVCLAAFNAGVKRRHL